MSLIDREAVLALPRNRIRNMRGEIVEETINVAYVEQLPSAQPDQNAYEQGRITGRVEMRTEMLSALESIVGREVWNNV